MSVYLVFPLPPCYLYHLSSRRTIPCTCTQPGQTAQERARAFSPFIMNRILAAAIVTLVVIPTSVDAWTKRKEAHGKTVIAYYASW